MTGIGWRHSVAEVPEDGLTAQKTATAEERVAVAAALAIPSCERIEARYRIWSIGSGGYRLEGEIVADVTQECVVTLEPVKSRINGRLDVEFQPGGRHIDADGEDVEDPFSEREMEPIEHGVLDIGRVVYEVIASLLDPYPRAPEAAFDWKDPKGDPARANPFAKLAALNGDAPKK